MSVAFAKALGCTVIVAALFKGDFLARCAPQNGI